MGAMSVVKINVLTVPAEHRETLEKRFASRAHTVESSDGFQAWMEGPMKAAHQGGGEGGERPRPAASDSTLWSFEVVQQAGPKGA
jgi:heme-degrading monooxygenase HmoA